MVELFDSLAGRIRFTYFCALFNDIFSILETASDVISGRFVGPIARHMLVTFSDPRLYHSREIPPEAVGGGSFGLFRTSITSDWK